MSRFRDSFLEVRDVTDPKHVPAECTDSTCELYGCRSYREGWADAWRLAWDAGFEAGWPEGHEVGWNAGFAAGAASAAGGAK